MAIQVTGEQYYEIDGQLSELKRQLRQPNGYPFDIAHLRVHLQAAVEGRFAVPHSIDCDAGPFCPEGLSILSSKEQLPKRVQGTFTLDRNIGLYVPEEQKNIISGNRVRELLQDQLVLPANVLDYLLAHSHLIPEEWKSKLVFFWGTIYRDSDGNLFVRYLHWGGARWHWDDYWLGHDFNDFSPAAVAAS